MRIKEVVKKLTCALNKRQLRRRVACDAGVITCTERVATLERRLIILKETIRTTQCQDTSTAAGQRAQTAQCIEDRLNLARKARDQRKAEIVACKKSKQKSNSCMRTLNDETLLNMLRYLLDRCSNELRGGEINCHISALWCEGEAIIAQREGRFCVANLMTKRSKGKNSEFQPKQFIKKVRRREFRAAPKRSGTVAGGGGGPIVCQ